MKKYTEDVIKVTVSCGDLKSSPLAFDIQRDKFAICVEAMDSIRIADLTLEIEIFIRIMSRSSLLSRAKISMERWGHGQDEWW